MRAGALGWTVLMLSGFWIYVRMCCNRAQIPMILYAYVEVHGHIHVHISDITVLSRMQRVVTLGRGLHHMAAGMVVVRRVAVVEGQIHTPLVR